MRWLGVLAVLLAGAAVYLYFQISEGSATPSPRRTATTVEHAPEPAPAAAAPTPPAATPYQPKASKPAAPTVATRAADRPAPSVDSAAPAVEPPPSKGPAELGDPDVPWTEAERQQWLWTANGRYEKGNYPRALEAALEISRRNPGSAWEQDAWRVAIKSYCAMNEPEKAQALFAKMTEPVGIEEATKGCAEWNVKLGK